ncbi:MAG: tetratricopeptide repeat protein [Deltaproteobacteria bacterium]|nr:tetratricopeptide repeat protein [Deltaproteobacteria bacterium]
MPPQLPLFDGGDLASTRFSEALRALDLAAATALAPPAWRPVVETWARALGVPGHPDLPALHTARPPDHPALVVAWNRLLGRALDSHGIPGVLGDEVAAAFLLRGGETDRARASLARHLRFHPDDPRAWALMVRFEGLPAAVRCGFHGGPLVDEVGDLVEVITADGLENPRAWLPAYAWLNGLVDLEAVKAALNAERPHRQATLPLPGDGRAFAADLVRAECTRLKGEDDPEVLSRMEAAGPAAFRRYRLRIG